MNVSIRNEWEHSEMYLEISVPFSEDYRMLMLSHNHIGGLLSVRGSGVEGKSRYTYKLDGSVCMEDHFREKEVSKRDIEQFTEQFLHTVEQVKKYLLDPDHILLSPQMIFVREEIFLFTYLPVFEENETYSLFRAFHEMMEYFVKKLDYSDVEGVHLVCMLHRETMKSSYDLKELKEQYKKEKRERQKEKKSDPAVPEAAVFTCDSETAVEKKEEYPDPGNLYLPEALKEQKRHYGPVRKIVDRIRTGRWGEWRDLITEMDGQEKTGDL